MSTEAISAGIDLGLSAPRYRLRRAEEALMECPPMEWLVEDLMPSTGVALVCGETGTKKTWSMLQLAVCVAMGKDWLGRAVKQGPVLVIDEESGDNRMRRRLGDVMRGGGSRGDYSSGVGVHGWLQTRH